MKNVFFGLFFVMMASCMVSAGPLLLQDSFNARSFGLSGSMAGVRGGLDTFSVNPASLTSLKTGAISAFFLPWQGGMNYAVFSAGLPVKAKDRYSGSLGFSLSLFSMDPMANFDQSGYRLPDLNAGDIMFTAGFGHPLFSNLDIGLNVKYFYTSLGDKRSGALAFDLGGLIFFNAFHIGPNPVPDNLSFGLSVQNIGFPQVFMTEYSPLPYKIRAGLSYLVYSRVPADGTVLLELNQTMDQALKLNFGIESVLWKILTVRLGARILGETLFGFSCGIGINLRLMNSDLLFDYSFLPLNDLGTGHAFSLKMMFS